MMTIAKRKAETQLPAVQGTKWAQKSLRKRKRALRKMEANPILPEGVLINHEIPSLLENLGVAPEDRLVNTGDLWYTYFGEVVSDVHVEELNSRGDGMALIKKDGKSVVCVIPFALPGDIVTVRLCKFKQVLSGCGYIEGDLLEVNSAGERRHDDKISCKYFGICSGCQFQQMDYEDQLVQKRQTIVHAYKYLVSEATRVQHRIDDKIEPTVGSPVLIGYRTKLTPHYDRSDLAREPPQMPAIGFEAKGRPAWRGNEPKRSVIDIEDCLIGTPIVRKGMANERRRVANRFKDEGSLGKKGATVLLRQDTKRIGEPMFGGRSLDLDGSIAMTKNTIDGEEYVETCVTDHNATVSEYINGLEFTFMANEFFQNNNSILPKVIEYVEGKLGLGDESYLVDAYCGSGLFSIALAKSVRRSLGVEISAQAIKYAKQNAEINKVMNCSFIEGKAEKLFESIDFPKDKTSVILDPPRKGCDKVFLDQLSAFEPKRIVYVSCNVHSQARDVEMFLTETKNGWKYDVESIRGFDFFPQTYHVESVAVLTERAAGPATVSEADIVETVTEVIPTPETVSEVAIA